jgi:hypothetical protein
VKRLLPTALLAFSLGLLAFPLALALALALALPATAAAEPLHVAAAAPLRVTAKPALFPSFSPAVHDYVSRCHPGVPLRLRIRAPEGGVRLNGGRPVRGRFHARVDMRSGEGVRIRARSGRYEIRCLADDFPRYTTERHGTPQAKWYLVTPTLGPHGTRYVALFDRNGVPVWWMRGKRKPHDAKLLPNGNIAWSFFTNQAYAAYSVPYEEHRLDGKLVRKLGAKGVATDPHDMQIEPNGNRLQVSYVPRDGVDLSRYGGPERATVTDAVVQELTPRGNVLFRWNSKNHIALDEAAPYMRSIIDGPIDTTDGRHAYDIVHVNSVERDGPGSLLISMRQTSGVYKVSKATGEVQWKLGGLKTPESLRVTGEPDDALVFGGQHDARLLRDGTITVFNNRTGTDLLPRAERYRVDESARTATLLEALTDPRSIPSTCCGSARRLPGGNWVVAWGFSRVVSELTPSGARVFGLFFRTALTMYRTVPVMPGQLSGRALRAGMDAMHPPASRPIPIRRGAR